MENVILVDENDQPLGQMEKLKAHEQGLLHRAFSVFLFNKKGELLLQKRAKAKYHSGGLWTNTCCSHPRVDEDLLAAVSRRLDEEMGVKANVEEVFSFIYKAVLDKGLTEHELDHVFFGRFEGEPTINLQEVEDFKYISKTDLVTDLDQNPEQYTEWFKIAMPEVVKRWPDHS